MEKINIKKYAFLDYDKKKVGRTTMEENKAYSFYFNKVYRTVEEPVIISIHKVRFENGHCYFPQFPEQWVLYNETNLEPLEVIYYDGSPEQKKKLGHLDLVIINFKVYKCSYLNPKKVKKIIKGYERQSLFDMEE